MREKEGGIEGTGKLYTYIEKKIIIEVMTNRWTESEGKRNIAYEEIDRR